MLIFCYNLIIISYIVVIGVKALSCISFITFLRETNTRIVAKKMLALWDNNLNIEKASDFDVYNCLCERLYLLCGHPIREKFLSVLSEASSIDINPIMLYDFDYRKKLWQKIFFDSNIVLPKVKDSIKSNFEVIEKKQDSVLNLNYEIYEIKETFDNIFSLLDCILEKIKTKNIAVIFFDAENIEYIRPDNFHAQIGYENFKKNGEESSIVLLWLICRILMNSDLKLVLKVDNAKKADEIIALIHRLGLSPKIALDIDICNYYDYSEIYCALIKYSKKNISLKLSCSKEIENENTILKIFNAIPLAFIESIDMRMENIKKIFNSMLTEREVALIIEHLYRAK